MPTTLVLLLAILAFLVALACLYLASSLNKKLNRLRRRYDVLLRGHGEMNMEEFLLSLGKELDAYKEERRETGQKLFHVEQWMAKTDTDQSAYVDEKFAVFSHQIEDSLQQTSQNLLTSMRRLDEQVYARMDAVEKASAEGLETGVSSLQKDLQYFVGELSKRIKVNEEDAFVRFDSLEKQAKEVRQDFANSLQEAHDGLAEELDKNKRLLTDKISGVQTMTQNRFQTLEQRTEEGLDTLRTDADQTITKLEQESRQERDKMAQDFSEQVKALDQATQEAMESMQEKVDSRITSYQQDLSNQMQSLDAKLRDQLSLALQKVVLYRYNAFDDISGESSFTAVFLDEHQSGLILTSIFSRNSTNTFAKEVKTGQALQKLSPEEEEALANAIKR